MTEFSLKRHVAVLLFCVGVIVMGTISYYSMPRESNPDVDIPIILVSTFLDGGNPTDIEQAVTIPLETKLHSIEGLKEMRSVSQDSFSIISMEFMPHVDKQTAMNYVRDAVDQAKPDLSPEAEEPIVKEFTLSSIPVLIYHFLATDKITVSELYDMVDDLEDELEQISGVLDVDIIGGREREMVIEVDPQRLHFYNLPLSQVQAILRGSNNNVSIGSADGEKNRVVMRLPGEFKNPGDIFKLVVGFSKTGKPIYLHDVAIVLPSFEDEKNRARLYDFSADDGENSINRYVESSPSVSIHIKKRNGVNMLEVCEKVAMVIDNTALPAEVVVVKGMDQSKKVREMIEDLENGIATSMVLVLLVIFFGLGWHNAFLVASAIPFSMLISFIVLKAMGQTLNMLVLFSLILALGMLVDNAIVIVENIYRHISLGVPRAKAALLGTSEVAWPVITSTATTVGAFLPMVFWPGVMGQFMSYLPRTVIVVLLASLFVALVINPTLSALFLKVKDSSKSKVDPETQRPNYLLARKYQVFLGGLLNRPYLTLSMTGMVFIFVFMLFINFNAGVELFPPVDPDMVTCSITPPEGISLEASDKLVAQLEDRLFGRPGSGYDRPVDNIKYAGVSISFAGSGGIGGNMGDDNSGPVKIQIEFVDRKYRKVPTPQTIKEMRARIAGLDMAENRVTYPLFGAEFDVIRPQEGPPIGKPVSIDIFGEDLNQMTVVIQDMKKLMVQTPGTVKPMDDATTAQPTLEWYVNYARAGMVGLEQASIGSFLQIAVGGLRTGTFGHGEDEQDIMLRLPMAYRLDTERLKNINIPTTVGGSVPMNSVAAAKLVAGPLAIKHYNKKRVLNAGCEVVAEAMRNDAGIRANFQKKVKEYPFPAGITYRFGGAAEEQQNAQDFLIKALFIAIFIILMVMVLQFNSILISGIVICSVLLSMMGVLFGLLVLHAPFGIIMTGIGVISLSGIVVNNAIVLLDAIHQFEDRGEEIHQAIISACMVRLRPVLLTAITTILGLVPMALKMNFDFRSFHFVFNSSSSQWWQSMATTVIFGLLIATILTLGVVPCLYLIHDKFINFLSDIFGWKKGSRKGLI